MSKFRWYKKLLSSNANYTLYTRADNSHLIMDTGPVLDKHSQFLDITKKSEDECYYYIKVNQGKIWVPILPGFTMLLTLKTVFSSFLLAFLTSKIFHFHGPILKKLRIIIMTFLRLLPQILNVIGFKVLLHMLILVGERHFPISLDLIYLELCNDW